MGIKLYRKVQKYFIVVLFVAALVVTFFQVVNRMIFKIPVSWPEECARYLLVWVTFMSAVAAVRNKSMAMIDIVVSNLKKPAKMIVEMISNIASFVFICIVTVNLVKVLGLQIETNQLTPALKISMAVPYFSILIWGILAMFETILIMYEGIKGVPKQQ